MRRRKRGIKELLMFRTDPAVLLWSTCHILNVISEFAEIWSTLFEAQSISNYVDKETVKDHYNLDRWSCTAIAYHYDPCNENIQTMK